MGVAGTLKARNGLPYRRSVSGGPMATANYVNYLVFPLLCCHPPSPPTTEDHLIRSAHLFPKAGEGVALLLLFFAVRVLRNKITNKYS